MAGGGGGQGKGGAWGSHGIPKAAGCGQGQCVCTQHRTCVCAPCSGVEDANPMGYWVNLSTRRGKSYKSE